MLEEKKIPSPMEDKAFSSIDFVGQCMLDQDKASAFRKVIDKVVRPDSHVLDVGTGSGILALFSARAGAKKVTALEYDPFVAEIARTNFKNNNYDHIIETVIGDARSFDFGKQRFDVVTMEMLTSGMVDEMQVQAINNLHERGGVSSSTVFIPLRQDTYVNLAHVNFKMFGFNMKMTIHAWKFFQKIKTADMSQKVLLNAVDFSKKIKESFDKTIKIKATKTGVVNTLWLSSRAFVDGKKFLENTKSLNPPVAIPLTETEISSGTELEIRVRYKFGYGYKNFSAEIL